MSDAINFPLSDPNGGGGIPRDMLGASCSSENGNEHSDGPADDTVRAAQPCDQPHLNSISSAAAEAARVLCSESSAKAQEEKCVPAPDRRRRRRALISAPVRVRGVNTTQNGPDEISTTVDVSRGGVLFIAETSDFERGMEVAVTFPYCSAPGALQAEQHGRIARVREMSDGRYAVAIALGVGAGEDLVDSCGRKLNEQEVRVLNRPAPELPRPLVLAVDPDDAVRETLRHYLTTEGYEVMAVKTTAEARDILDNFTPALIIAEVVGEGLPGFELCAYVKSSDKLRRIPVLLTTGNGNPTDYSSAHSLGAVVCMAKPYKQERLGHVVRLLAPSPQVLASNAPAPRAPDPSRRTFNGSGAKSPSSNGGSRRFRFSPFR
jgi:CheY-like chemotaxis protein